MNSKTTNEDGVNTTEINSGSPASAAEAELQPVSKPPAPDASISDKPQNNSLNKKTLIIGLSALLVIAISLVATFVVNNSDQSIGKTEDNKAGTEIDTLTPYAGHRIIGNNLNDFDLDFLKMASAEENLLYSPLSIKYALSMLNDGTEGASKAQIDALIGDYQPKNYLNSANMSFANALFVKETYKDKIKSSYTDNLKGKYGAELFYDPFNAPDPINKWVSGKTFGLINDLIEDTSDIEFFLINALAIDMEWKKKIQATDDQDEYIVSYPRENYWASIQSLNADSKYGTIQFGNRSINAKAVEFGASINNYDIVNILGKENIRNTVTAEYKKFLEENVNRCVLTTEDRDVAANVNQYISELDSNYKRVDVSTDFKFADNEDVKVFTKELKEYDGITLEYVGIMPKNQPLSQYIKTLSAQKVSEAIASTKTITLDNFKPGNIYQITGGVPLFNYDYDLKLKDNLKRLGVIDIFTQGKANLLKITDDPELFIDQAVHKANIEFSNEGIKAAAATVYGGGRGADGCSFDYRYDVPIVKINLTFNNPYLYIIRDKNSGEVWFIGTVYEPIKHSNKNYMIK